MGAITESLPRGEVVLLLSMTGFGEARHQTDDLRVVVELRAVNNRYLKITLRTSEAISRFEPEIERILRQTIRRGTIQAQVQFHHAASASAYSLNRDALRSYYRQLEEIQGELGAGFAAAVTGILGLPGVADEPVLGDHSADPYWPIVEETLREALEKLQQMRRQEGEAMAGELLALRAAIAAQLEHIRCRAPVVVETFRERLFERVGKLLAELDVQLDRSDLIKEVAVFAERSDITEEVVRLASHLDQFAETLDSAESPGRKLDFLTQEMFRETTTIGAKASDVEIARRVVEIKGAIEKIRELIQNIE